LFLFVFFGTIQIRQTHRAGALRYLGDPHFCLDCCLFSLRAGLQPIYRSFAFAGFLAATAGQSRINFLQFHFLLANQIANASLPACLDRLHTIARLAKKCPDT
jgi:hypothetical protein